MWVPRYSRNNPDFDNGSFGEICPLYSITDTNRHAPFTRTVTKLPTVVCPQSRVFQKEDCPTVEFPYFLDSCSAMFRYGFTEPVTATTFLPEHAIFVQSDGGCYGLIEESLWHSRLFFSSWFKNDRSTRWQWKVDRAWEATETVEGLVNFCYHRMEFQYFHWLVDTLPRVWLLKEESPYGNSRAKWYVGPLRSNFQLQSLQLLGVSPQDCLQLGTSIVRFERMVCPGFLFTEPLHTRPSLNAGIHHKGWSVGYIHSIRERAWHRHGKERENGDLLLYVSRGDAEHRRILNEDEVRAKLESLGFIVIEPGGLSFDEQVRLFSRARVVIGAHGAGLTNILWSPAGIKVLEFLPKRLPDAGYRFLANLCGHQHHAIICQDFEHRWGLAFSDIKLNLDVLNLALREVL